jgi:pyruvate kinase
MSFRLRRTTSVAAPGPATDNPAVSTGITRAGAAVVRLNFSHGDGDMMILTKGGLFGVTGTTNSMPIPQAGRE